MCIYLSVQNEGHLNRTNGIQRLASRRLCCRDLEFNPQQFVIRFLSVCIYCIAKPSFQSFILHSQLARKSILLKLMLVRCSIRGGNYLPLIELHTHNVIRAYLKMLNEKTISEIVQ